MDDMIVILELICELSKVAWYKFNIQIQLYLCILTGKNLKYAIY